MEGVMLLVVLWLVRLLLCLSTSFLLQIEPGVMDEGPRSKDEPILEGVILTGIAVQVSFCSF